MLCQAPVLPLERGGGGGWTYRELNKAEDEHGGKAAKVRVREEAAKKGQKENGADEVSDYVGGL